MLSPRLRSSSCDEPHAKNQNGTMCLRARPPRLVFICLGGRFHNNFSAHPSPSTPHGSDYGRGMQHVSPLTLKHPCVPAALRPSALLHPSHSGLRQITSHPPSTGHPRCSHLFIVRGRLIIFIHTNSGGSQECCGRSRCLFDDGLVYISHSVSFKTCGVLATRLLL